jgi:hypothetical protein
MRPMNAHLYRGRKSASIENDSLRVTVLEGGGHVAEILDKQTGINPLWTPEWPSIEPETFNRDAHLEYGDGAEAQLLAGIMGHNLCLDLFGGPSPDEAAAGLTVHGEAPIVRHEIAVAGQTLTSRAKLPVAQIAFERRLELCGSAIQFQESVENLSSQDRPIGWTQHATLGPPFLEKGSTEFRLTATKSQVYERAFSDHGYLQRGAIFDWPTAPGSNGAPVDLRRFTDRPKSAAYTAHLLDPSRQHAFFVAFAPRLQLAFGYIWNRAEFPWIGIWEENFSRSGPPWNGSTLTRGMEFGVSPFPETRREMVDRGRCFDTPVFRWLPARSRLSVEYWAVMQHTPAVPEALEWPVKG